VHSDVVLNLCFVFQRQMAVISCSLSNKSAQGEIWLIKSDISYLFSVYYSRFTQSIQAFEVLTFPQNDPDAVTITQKDIQRLKPKEFLNDTIIDFYIK
jgi:Ulp1 family protease